MTNIKITDLPLDKSQVSKIVDNFSYSEKDINTALQYLEYTIDGTSDIDVMWMVHHLIGYKEKHQEVA